MKPVIWLRISYWTGAIADGLVGVLILIPDRMGETGFRYPMGLAASLMFGWAALLIWADRRPAERRGVLPLTAAVVLGLLASGVLAVAAGIFPLARILPTTVSGVVLIALFVFSHLKAGKAEGGPG